MIYGSTILSQVTASPDPKADIEKQLTLFQQAMNKMVSTGKQWIDEHAISVILAVVLAFVVYFVGSKLIKWTLRFTKRALDRSSVEEGAVGFICTLIKYTSYTVLIMIVAGILGIDTTSFVALLGSAGLTVGLALKGTMSNFAGGLLILFTKPFKVGDYILAAGNEGRVIKIDLFYTHMVTADNQSIVLPNGDLSNMQLTNATNEEKRRLDIFVPVAYSSDMDQVRSVILKACEQNEYVLKEEPMEVHLFEFGDSALNISVRVWTETDNYWPLKWSLQEEIKKVLDEAGIEIPFNQIEVKMK